ncbi:MAG TPA: hypothetical protein VGU01_03050 [Sphingomicrobium sp.]|nr:hypothetical protein [Sphingomicrobium sp.]
MGWSIGFDSNWNRDIGYGVPATCDHPDCNAKIDRGLSHVCGAEPYGGEEGCGLYFCGDHLFGWEQKCQCCYDGKEPFAAKPDHPDWINWKLTDASWHDWRQSNPEEVEKLRAAIAQAEVKT